MNPIIRNLISVVRRFRLAASLNILGLSVAFAAFMVIMIQLDYDYNFDKCHQDYDKIFRLEFSINYAGNLMQAPRVIRPLSGQFVESSPHIVAGAVTYPSMSKNFFHVENAGERNFFEEYSLAVTPEYFDVFTFDFIEGAKEVLKIPGNVIIPLSLSRKLFGKESAIDRQIFFETGNRTVGAVYRDLPSNTIVKNCIYLSIPENEDSHSWAATYVRVNHPSNTSQIIDNFKRNFDAQAYHVPMIFTGEEANADLRLTALTNIHFTADLMMDETPKASKQTLMILFSIAIVIIVIAGINFTNFSTALAPMRIKNINTMRVLGVRRNSIRLQIVSEAIFFSLLSCLVAFFLVSLFYITPLAMLVDVDLSLTAHPLIAGGTVLVALFAGLLAGAYPAHFMTSFAPALVLKGNFGLSPKGRKLRNTLIGVQFAASFVLIVGASFMYLQNRFMQNSHLGYDRDNIIIVETERIEKSRDAFANQIKAYSGVKDVTHGAYLLPSNDEDSSWTNSYRGEDIMFQVFPVHHTFLDLMGIAVTEGRGFRQEDETTEDGVWIFNESARKQFNLELNTKLESRGSAGEIIGFIPDIKYASFRMAVEPMAFFIFPSQWNRPLNYTYIKLHAGTNLRSAISHIHTTLADFDAGYPYELRFFDELVQLQYENEASLGSLISLFSIMAIFISIVGVFGLVIFDSECRRKEIGIRKVLGASTTGIIIMFNRAYFKILVICFVIAAPLAWYAVTRWLENFAYKTPMYWWVYILAFWAVAVITACTVTFQNWRVANDDPVKAIKSE